MLIKGLALILTIAVLVSSSYSSVRFESDLVRLMNGKFAPTTLHSTVTILNGTAVAEFWGDKTSNVIDVFYLLFANSSKQISEVELTRNGKSKLTFYNAPHVLTSSNDDAVVFFLTDGSTWTGNATFPLWTSTTFALAARLEGHDVDDPSSYLCTYQTPNAGISMPDRQVLDRFRRIGAL